MTYEQARRDFEFLETIIELADQVDLDSERENLMQNPTKKTAGRMYQSAVTLWFDENPVTEETEEIAERHGIDPQYCGSKNYWKNKM